MDVILRAAKERLNLLRRDARDEQRRAAASIGKRGYLHWRLVDNHCHTMRAIDELETALQENG